MSKPTPPTYKTRNWPTYNKALMGRGSLTIWFDPAMTWEAVPTGKRGRQPDYSDAAIHTCLTLTILFGMALRQSTGFVESLPRLTGLDWSVPDFSTLSRRQKTLKVNVPYRGSDGPLHLLVPEPAPPFEGPRADHPVCCQLCLVQASFSHLGVLSRACPTWAQRNEGTRENDTQIR